MELVSKINELYAKVDVEITKAAAYAEADDSNDATAIFQKVSLFVINYFPHIVSVSYKDPLLKEIAVAQTKARLYTEAKVTAKMISDDDFKVKVMTDIIKKSLC